MCGERDTGRTFQFGIFPPLCRDWKIGHRELKQLHLRESNATKPSLDGKPKRKTHSRQTKKTFWNSSANSIEDVDECDKRQFDRCSYRAGDDTHILGILFEPVVHVLTHSKQVVEAGRLAGRPVTL